MEILFPRRGWTLPYRRFGVRLGFSLGLGLARGKTALFVALPNGFYGFALLNGLKTLLQHRSPGIFRLWGFRILVFNVHD
jgi:hypothetical protein